MRYATRQDAIEQAILPVLDNPQDFDVEAICREAFDYRVDTDQQDNELLNTAGFEQVVSDVEFWVILSRYSFTADESGCEGHESLDGAHMGETVYCDGTCA